MTTRLPVFVSLQTVQQSIRFRRKLRPGVNTGLNMLIFRSFVGFTCEAAPLETVVKNILTVDSASQVAGKLHWTCLSHTVENRNLNPTTSLSVWQLHTN